LIAWYAILVVCSEDERYRRPEVLWHGVHAEQHRDHAGHVESLLAPWQAAAEHQVVDRGRVQLRDLRERRGYHLHRDVVWPDRGQRSLERPADRRAGGCDDDCLWHELAPPQIRSQTR
jgi:hypothetical protein